MSLDLIELESGAPTRTRTADLLITNRDKHHNHGQFMPIQGVRTHINKAKYVLSAHSASPELSPETVLRTVFINDNIQVHRGTRA